MSDPLARPATPSVLRRLRDAGVLDAAELRRALALALRTPAVDAWHRFLDRALLGTGAALVLAGILYFFARNWAELGRFGRFTIVEAAILIAALVAWRGGLDRLTGQIGGFAVTALAGVALAVIGQSYQLGADPWRLFAITAALGVPWLLATRFAPLFVLLLVLVHVALLRWWPVDGEVDIYKLLLTSVGIDALAWMAWERVPTVRAMAGRWVPRLLAAPTLLPLTIGAAWLMFDDRAFADPERPLAWQAAILVAWVVATAVSLWVFERWRPDLFVLALAAVGVVMVVAVRLIRAVFDGLDTDSGTLALLITALILSAAAGLAATWLRRLQLQLPDTDDSDASSERNDVEPERSGDAGGRALRGLAAGAASAVATAGGIASSPVSVGRVLAALVGPSTDDDHGADAVPGDQALAGRGDGDPDAMATSLDGDQVLDAGDPVLDAGDPVLDASDPVLDAGDPVPTEPDRFERAAATLARRGGEGSPWYVRLLVAGVAWLAALALFGAIGAFFLIEEVSLAFGVVMAIAVPLLARRLPADEVRGAGAEFLAQWILVGSLAARILVAAGVYNAAGDSLTASLLGLALLEVWLGITVADRLQRFLAAGLSATWLLAALMQFGRTWPALESGFDSTLALRTALVVTLTAVAGWLWVRRARLEAGRVGEWHSPVAHGLTLFVLAVPGVASLLNAVVYDARPLFDARVLSAVLIALLLALWWVVIRDLGRSPTGPAALVVAGLVVGLGVAAWREPGLLVAFGALVLAFHVRARRLSALAIVAIAVFLSLYYYHLELDFFTKALVLVGSGLVLLAGRWALQRTVRDGSSAPSSSTGTSSVAAS